MASVTVSMLQRILPPKIPFLVSQKHADFVKNPEFCHLNMTVRGLLLQHLHRISMLYSYQFVAKSVESL